MNGKIVEANVAKLGSALKISVIMVGVHVEIPSFTTEKRPIGISMNRAPGGDQELHERSIRRLIIVDFRGRFLSWRFLLS